MRITNSMLVQSAIAGMRRQLRDLAGAQARSATLQRVDRMSDDPVVGAELSRISSSLRDIDQFKKNATSARTMLSAEDAALTAMRTLFQQAREVAGSVAGLSPLDPQRQRAVSQLADIQKQLVALGNTRVGDQYIFGGTHTTSPPFMQDGTYVGDSNQRSIAIDENVSVDTVHPGDHSFGGALISLTSLENNVASEAEPEVDLSIANLQGYEDQLLADQAQVGARLQTIDQTQTRLAQRASTTLDRRDAMNAIDPAEAVVKLQTAQTALERSYAVVSRVLQTNILDYLR